MSTLTRAQKVIAAAARIFGNHVNTTGLQSGRKVLQNPRRSRGDQLVRAPHGRTRSAFSVPLVEQKKLKIEPVGAAREEDAEKGQGNAPAKVDFGRSHATTHTTQPPRPARPSLTSRRPSRAR